ncbi:type VI secretion system Vgr family protein [Sorangium sp. So ce362]|uniref:type VI secretion system Vgr family protein n=1 Tax=Sorangium sp. So ce362 TaxID=3133303 RepID=UPI003F641EB2
MNTVSVHLSCDGLPTDLNVVRAHGTEAMNAFSRWDVEILCTDAALDLDAAIGASAALGLVDDLEQVTRTVSLVVTEVVFEAEGREGFHFRVKLAPPQWLLGLRAGYRVFVDKNVREIVQAVLNDAGLGDGQVWRITGQYVKRPYCVQYGETEWAFIERILADEGISYWFDATDDGTAQLVFGDDLGSYDGVPGGSIQFEDGSGMVRGRHLSELEIVEVMTPTAVHLREHDVRAPDVFIEGKAGEGELEWFEYPASVLTAASATDRARARLEQLQRLKIHALAHGNSIRLRPGRVVTIDGCSDDWMNQEYLVVGLEHEVVLGSRDEQRHHGYQARALLVPKTRAFRPDVPRSAPRVPGLEPAMTTGPSGQEIHVDDLGRVKVRFAWDRSGVMDDRSSYWVRCLQMGMGGSMLLPRVGWEVPVGYIAGDPDRPFVLGRIYNGMQVVPYGLPGAKATTSLQSATSPGGGTTNEIRMVDSAGKQEMFIHAVRDQTVTVGGSADSSVSVNETHDVGLSLSVNVSGSQTHTVGASQTVNIGAVQSTDVKGSRTEMVGGMELLKVTANRVVEVKGAYTELIGAAYGIQCNQSNYEIKGAFTQLIGATMKTVAGLGATESTAAARTEIVGGSRSLKTSRGTSVTIIGTQSITAGSTSEKADAGVETNTKVAGKIDVGGAATIKAGGEVLIEASSITIDVSGNIKAQALHVGGGKLKAKKGSTQVHGTISRQGGSKIG